MQDLKNSVAAETKASPTSSANELHLEIMVSFFFFWLKPLDCQYFPISSFLKHYVLCISQKFREEIEEEESLLEKLQDCSKEAELKANELKAAFENLYGMLAIHLFFLEFVLKT